MTLMLMHHTLQHEGAIAMLGRLRSFIRRHLAGIQRAKVEYALDLVLTEKAMVYATKLFYSICKNNDQFGRALFEAPTFVTMWHEFYHPRLQKALNHADLDLQDKGLRALLLDCIDLEHYSIWSQYCSKDPWVVRAEEDLLLLGVADEQRQISSSEYRGVCNNLRLVSSISSTITLTLLKHYLDDDVSRFYIIYQSFADVTEQNHVSYKVAALQRGEPWTADADYRFIALKEMRTRSFVDAARHVEATESALEELTTLMATRKVE